MKYLLHGALMPAICCLSLAVAHAADAPGQASVTVAALPFHQAFSQEIYAPLAEAINDLVLDRLAAVQGLVLVDRTAIDKVLQEQRFSLLTSQADRVRLGQIVGAKFLLTGSVAAVDDQFEINAHLLDVSTARVARSAKVTARSDHLTRSVDKLVSELVEPLNL